jgi:hypothetical protein
MNSLLFVYNAGSSKWQLALDIAHKILSPATYPCKLCDLTHGILKIRPQWQAFLEQLDFPVQFLHSDEFQKAYPEWKELQLPAVLLQSNQRIDVVMDYYQLEQLPTVEVLIQRVKALLPPSNSVK